MKQPLMAHTWQYFTKVTGNNIVYFEHWKCRTCGIVSLMNPFSYPEHIVELEKAHLKKLREINLVKQQLRKKL